MKTLLTTFLQVLHVPFTKSYANTLYLEHPYRDTLYGLSDILSRYGIDNCGVEIDDKDLTGLSMPFIAHVGNDFVVVKHLDNRQVQYIWRNKYISVPVDEFRRVWSGFALLVEPNEQSKEPDYHKHRKVDILKRIGSLSLFSLLVCWLIISCLSKWNYFTITHGLLLMFCFAGLGISFLLLQKQVRLSGEYIEKICSLFKQGDCNSVLESKAAKLWGIFSWSEIGFCYFITTFLLLIFYPQFIHYIVWISWFVLPYSLWSVWYQFYKVRQWCPLCLSVMLILWGMAVSGAVSYVWLPLSIEVKDLVLIAILYLLILGLLNFYLDVYSRTQRFEIIKHNLNRLKSSEEVFWSLLKSQPYYEVNESISCICFGNTKAELQITILSNPHCDPCAQLHERMERLLAKAGNVFYLRYIFSSFNKKMEESARFLIAAYQNETQQDIARIYRDWFAGKKYLGKEYINQFPYNTNLSNTIKEWEKHNVWMQKYKLSTTPTVLVNGYLLPEYYTVEDVVGFVDVSK